MQLDLTTKTLISEFMELVFSRKALEVSAQEIPIFVKKEIKGNIYWYKQRYENGKALQEYFGPSNKKNNTFIATARKNRKENTTQLKSIITKERRLGAMLRRGELPSIDARIAKVLTKLSDAQLIDTYGILVGTFAFISYTTCLGHLFKHSLLSTNDIDIVRDTSLEIAACKPIDAESFFVDSELACRSIPGFSPTSFPASFITKDGLRIDLLVPLRGVHKELMPMPKVAGASAVPLRFLDFLIRNPIRSVLISPHGGIPVLVPHPVRFTIHKLIIAQYRSITEGNKKAKDLYQAEELLPIIAEEYPTDLRKAYKEACRQGKKWQTAIKKSLEFLPKKLRILV